MTIRRSGPNVVDVNNERLTFEDEMTASDFIACLSHGDVESCSLEFPPEQTEYIGDEIGDPHDSPDANPRTNSIKDKRPAPTKKPAPKKPATKS
ncbi:hypothetical protein [Burkholderia sp. L27(2015)]|uniref:hypothetical protein n=1 Tax=Burkholderia sp. L27(2015) TaxID=1641858 RepID=UPI00131C9AAC|nr:hypothetical protein [Burkholderia sp. L27(2015)]